MRLAILLAALVVAGCVSTPTDDGSDETAPRDDATPEAGDNATAPAAPMGERMPATTERFALLENHTLGVLRADAAEIPIANVPESISPAAFYQGFTQPLTLPPWLSPPFRNAWESTGDIEVTLSFMADAAAASTNPKPAGFPAVGGWLGTADRFAFFLLATDAPDTLEAGKVYTVKLVAKPPQGGFFVREGEQLGLHTFLSYQTADGRPASYVVGGSAPASIVVPHTHFNLSAELATVLLEEKGELPPNPGPTGDMMQDPPELAFSVPADALYLVAHVSGASKAGSRADIDLKIVSPGGDIIADGSSSGGSEVVSLGPGNLQAYGRELVARITGSVIPAGGTFSVTVTAYSP